MHLLPLAERAWARGGLPGGVDVTARGILGVLVVIALALLLVGAALGWWPLRGGAPYAR